MKIEIEKYEEKLWGKVDFLHEKTVTENNKMNIFSDIILKYQQAIISFSKAIENIKTLNTEIISEKENSINKSVEYFKKVINIHINEFKECSNHMKKTIIDPILKTKDEKYSEEKEMYNQYNKLKNLYNNLKSSCDKSKKEFNVNAKYCEDNVRNLIQYKSNTLTNESENGSEIIKNEEKMKLSLTNTKNLEEKYIKNIEEANNIRIKMVKKEEELLQFYQKINYDFYNKVSCAIIYIIPILKNLFHNILLELKSAETLCKKMNIKNDLNDFIINNTTNLSKEKEIIFEPYIPEADLKYTNISGKDKKDLENLDINYQILDILKKNFKEIRPDINMGREQKKYRLRFLCNEIFKIGSGVGFTSEDKVELINLIKEPKCKSFFLIILSKQRTKGRFKRSEKLVKDLVDIIINVLDSSEEVNDFESAKNCIILSETFYFEREENKKEDNKKIYLIDYIKYYKWFQDINFWEGIIENMIQKEIIKSEKINKKNKTKETPEEIKSKISNIGFSIVLSYTNTMVEFNISKENINKIVDIFVQKYNIEKINAQMIYENVEGLPIPETSEENKKIFEEMYEQFIKNKNNENIIEENEEQKIEENNIGKDQNNNNEENKIEIKENNNIEENNKIAGGNIDINKINIKQDIITGLENESKNEENKNEEIKENSNIEGGQNNNINENDIRKKENEMNKDNNNQKE